MINTSEEKMILIGAGGHARVIIDALRVASRLDEIYGIVDQKLEVGSFVDEIKVVGRDEDLKVFYEKGIKKAFIAVGSLGDCSTRKELASKLKLFGYQFPIIIHPAATLSPKASLSAGTFVGAGSIIQTGSRLGQHVIANTGSIIDHDCIVGDFCHIAPGVSMSGGVIIGDETHVGTGSNIIEYRKIGKRCVIGAGSVVIRDIPDDTRAFGVPSRIQE